MRDFMATLVTEGVIIASIGFYVVMVFLYLALLAGAVTWVWKAVL